MGADQKNRQPAQQRAAGIAGELQPVECFAAQVEIELADPGFQLLVFWFAAQFVMQAHDLLRVNKHRDLAAHLVKRQQRTSQENEHSRCHCDRECEFTKGVRIFQFDR